MKKLNQMKKSADGIPVMVEGYTLKNLLAKGKEERCTDVMSVYYDISFGRLPTVRYIESELFYMIENANGVAGKNVMIDFPITEICIPHKYIEHTQVLGFFETIGARIGISNSSERVRVGVI